MTICITEKPSTLQMAFQTAYFLSLLLAGFLNVLGISKLNSSSVPCCIPMTKFLVLILLWRFKIPYVFYLCWHSSRVWERRCLTSPGELNLTLSVICFIFKNVSLMQRISDHIKTWIKRKREKKNKVFFLVHHDNQTLGVIHMCMQRPLPLLGLV